MTPQEHLEESVNYALKTVELGNNISYPNLNETEQGIFDWGLDFLEMQKRHLESMIKDLSGGNIWLGEVNKAHIITQIQLLDMFVELIKNKTVLASWENDPKAR